jgi:hypothetical protein
MVNALIWSVADNPLVVTVAVASSVGVAPKLMTEVPVIPAPPAGTA